MSKSVIKFETPRNWKIADREVQISKIETNTYFESGDNYPKHRNKIDRIDPIIALNNIIKNVALLPNASFLEVDATTVLARINDVVGTTLIRTEWKIPVLWFNQVVQNVIYNNSNVKPELFYVTSKIS